TLGNAMEYIRKHPKRSKSGSGTGGGIFGAFKKNRKSSLPSRKFPRINDPGVTVVLAREPTPSESNVTSFSPEKKKAEAEIPPKLRIMHEDDIKRDAMDDDEAGGIAPVVKATPKSYAAAAK